MTLLFTPADFRNAESLMYAIAHGALIEGHNAARCTHRAGCETLIEFVDSDIDGPDIFQPGGFLCADHWTCNAHGDRELGICNDCLWEHFGKYPR